MCGFIKKETTKHITEEISTFRYSSPSNYKLCINTCMPRTVSELHIENARPLTQDCHVGLTKQIDEVLVDACVSSSPTLSFNFYFFIV